MGAISSVGGHVCILGQAGRKMQAPEIVERENWTQLNEYYMFVNTCSAWRYNPPSAVYPSASDVKDGRMEGLKEGGWFQAGPAQQSTLYPMPCQEERRSGIEISARVVELLIAFPSPLDIIQLIGPCKVIVLL